MKEKDKTDYGINHLLEYGKKINGVSPSMCLAKWLQSTIYLHNGHTHSCHHPRSHKVPLEELKNDPSALHNTSLKKTCRQQMLVGERPSECQYCWNIEDLIGDHISDRMYKSTDVNWAWPNLNKVLEAGSQTSLNPSYLEVSFSSTCNFKCAYCSPEVSSSWQEEIKEFGPYPTSTKLGNIEWLEKEGRTAIPLEAENPYVDAFWKWWPNVYPELATFRITGGEPLLSPHTWRVLDYILENPRSDLNFAINTNFGVPDRVLERLFKYIPEIKDKLRSFHIFTSCESHGGAADYVRFGLDYKKFMSNVERYLEITPEEFIVNIMVTFNALSLTTFVEFLKNILELREKFNHTETHNRIPIMISYLRAPEVLSMKILPKEIRRKYSQEIIDFIAKGTHLFGGRKECGRFYLEELDQAKRLAEFMNLDFPTDQLAILRKDFGLFIDEYDRRRGTDFNATFPELSEFYSQCHP